ncbi:MAG: DUF6309 family protein [bacterium]|jgi:hypothetical protein|nr:DUF6309 family protein [bacterium]
MKHLTAQGVKDLMSKEAEGSAWASETLKYALSTVDECEEKPNPTWWIGSVTPKDLGDIQLPEHRHDLSEEPTEPISFPDDTAVTEAIRRLKESPELYANICKSHVESLSESMLVDGFTSRLMLEEKTNGHYHLDGLHRLLALELAIQKGMNIETIPCIFFKTTE